MEAAARRMRRKIDGAQAPEPRALAAMFRAYVRAGEADRAAAAYACVEREEGKGVWGGGARGGEGGERVRAVSAVISAFLSLLSLLFAPVPSPFTLPPPRSEMERLG
jgi:hypothetical protein